jgi:hypothetical protein
MDPQFRQHIALIVVFTLGVAIGGFCFELVGHGPAEIPTYTARLDYYSGMVSNGKDRCPGEAPKGVQVVDIR